MCKRLFTRTARRSPTVVGHLFRVFNMDSEYCNYVPNGESAYQGESCKLKKRARSDHALRSPPRVDYETVQVPYKNLNTRIEAPNVRIAGDCLQPLNPDSEIKKDFEDTKGCDLRFDLHQTLEPAAYQFPGILKNIPYEHVKKKTPWP